VAKITVKRVGTVALTVLLWACTLQLVLVFARAGTAKFSDTSGWATAFDEWGYPRWFRMLVGLAELAGALLLLVPRLAVHGCALIAAVMLGAMATHIMHGDPAGVTHEVFPLVLALLVAALRLRRRAAAPLPAPATRH
jgi:uncharacterized membrane protein YphA (DoxX/SURF4 family)